MKLRGAVLLAGLLLAATQAQAATVNAAVAANFTKVATDLAALFQTATGNEVKLSFGSSGALYTQISQGAPFDVFLSADDVRPAKAISDGFGVADTDFTYAIGKVVLYAPGTDVSDGAAALKAGAFAHLAVADAKAAPYGAAAMQVLQALGLSDALKDRIVTGENITQTLQFVDSGSAELGFVALSQVVDKPAGEVWAPPAADYDPIRQDAVLLDPGKDNAAATAFLDFLRTPAAVQVIEAAGYAVEPAP